MKKKLCNVFELKDLGSAAYYLGMEFTQAENIVRICQRGYTQELLQRFRMSACNPISTPMEIGIKLTKNEHPSDEDQDFSYREFVGALTYLSVTTRPDISYAENYLGQFNNCNGSEIRKLQKRVLCYLKRNIHKGIIYKKDETPMQGYVDADWESCVIDRKSYSGYIFTLGGGPNMTLKLCLKEAIYIQRLVRDLGFEEFAN